MAQEAKKSRQEGIATEEIAALQARVAAGQLQAEDFSRLNKLLELLLTLLQMIEHPKLKLRKIRRKLFGDRAEPPAPPPDAGAGVSAAESAHRRSRPRKPGKRSEDGSTYAQAAVIASDGERAGVGGVEELTGTAR